MRFDLANMCLFLCAVVETIFIAGSHVAGSASSEHSIKEIERTLHALMKYAVCPITKFLVEIIKDLESFSQLIAFRFIFMSTLIFIYCTVSALAQMPAAGTLWKVSILQPLTLFPRNAAGGQQGGRPTPGASVTKDCVRPGLSLSVTRRWGDSCAHTEAAQHSPGRPVWLRGRS